MGAISANHIEALKKRGINIVAVCDIDKGQAERKLLQCKTQAKIYTDYITMYEEIRPDVVHICTPHYLHSEMVVNALKRNINVLSEKPVCINFEQLRELSNAYKKSSAKYAICFQNRFLPANIEIRKLIENAKIYFASGSVLWNRTREYYESGAWRGKWATEGGGALINQAIHTLDLLINTLGLPNSVKASMDNTHLKSIIEVEDEMIIKMNYDKFEVSFIATTAAKESFPVRIDFSTDQGIISASADKLFINGKEINIEENKYAINGKVDWGYGHNILISEFYDNLENSSEKFECDFDNCVNTMLVTLSAYESAKTGKEITLKENNFL